jgi:hypothetical protein
MCNQPVVAWDGKQRAEQYHLLLIARELHLQYDYPRPAETVAGGWCPSSRRANGATPPGASGIDS